MLIAQGSLATTSFITVPAVLAIASNADANQSLQLIKRRVNLMTAVCGTVSVGTLGLAFIFGAKHGYLVYAGITSAVLLRNQTETICEIGAWLKEGYEVTKEFVLEFEARRKAKSTAHRHIHRPATPHRTARTAQVPHLPHAQVAGALEKLGAMSLANCVVSGFAFGIASIGVLGDMG
jgi:hypothetical protein